jgi:hypothetical protein
VTFASAVVMVASFVAPSPALITGFNLLAVPVVLWLGFVLRPPVLAAAAAALGLVTALAWATWHTFPSRELVWLVAGSLWWLLLGVLLLRVRVRLAWFTLALAVICAFDAWATAASAGQPLMGLAGFKLLLTPPWLVIVAVALLRDPVLKSPD